MKPRKGKPKGSEVSEEISWAVPHKRAIGVQIHSNLLNAGLHPNPV